MAEIDIQRALRTAVAMCGYSSMREFSNKSGIYYGSLMWWVRKERSPNLANLERVANSLDMKVSELIALGE